MGRQQIGMRDVLAFIEQRRRMLENLVSLDDPTHIEIVDDLLRVFVEREEQRPFEREPMEPQEQMPERPTTFTPTREVVRPPCVPEPVN